MLLVRRRCRLMSSGLIVTLEMFGVLGIVLGLAVWELVRLRRDRRREPPANPE